MPNARATLADLFGSLTLSLVIRVWSFIGHWVLVIHWSLGIGHWAFDFGLWTDLDFFMAGPAPICLTAPAQC
jgi:hypothetical protein